MSNTAYATNPDWADLADDYVNTVEALDLAVKQFEEVKWDEQ